LKYTLLGYGNVIRERRKQTNNIFHVFLYFYIQSFNFFRCTNKYFCIQITILFITGLLIFLLILNPLSRLVFYLHIIVYL